MGIKKSINNVEKDQVPQILAQKQWLPGSVRRKMPVHPAIQVYLCYILHRTSCFVLCRCVSKKKEKTTLLKPQRFRKLNAGLCVYTEGRGQIHHNDKCGSVDFTEA